MQGVRRRRAKIRPPLSTIENLNDTRTGDAGGILDALRRRWPLVLSLILVGSAIGVAQHQLAEKSYEATASVALSGSDTLSQALLQAGNASLDPERDVATKVLVVKSPRVAARVAQQLRVSAPPPELLDQVSVEAAPNADVLNITAASPNPVYAARLANAFAKQYIAFEASSQLAAIEGAQRELEQQLRSLTQDSPQADGLQQSLQRLTELRAVAGGGTRLIGAAIPSTQPVGLGLVAKAALGGLIGLALAFSLVVMLESRDRRIRSTQGFEQVYGLPVLASVPQSAFKTARDARSGEQLEPFRILRTALDFIAAARPLDTVLITSAVAGEGKTTVAVNLARAYAVAGRDVVLVELDLRQPSFGRHFAIDPRAGVTTTLIGRTPLGDVLINVLPTLSVLPAGPLPPNPSELLGSPALTRLLSELSGEGRLVILDAPPLNPVADAQALVSHSRVDAAIVVGRLGLTSMEQARRARVILDRYSEQPVGVVVTGLERRDHYGYGGYLSAEDGEAFDAPPADIAGTEPGASGPDSSARQQSSF